MSAPMRRAHGMNDLRQAPPHPVQTPPLAPEPQASAQSVPSTSLRSPPMAPGVGGPNLDLPLPPLRPFGGDLAIAQLRRQLALHPNAPPQPPVDETRRRAIPWIAKVSLVFLVAGLGCFVSALLLLPRTAGPPMEEAARVTPAQTLAVEAPASAARLVIESQRAFANEPLPLGISLVDATGEETVTLAGLESGTKLSAGSALTLTAWEMRARDLGHAFAYAPKNFVGAMNAAINLRSARDRVVDSQMVRLEWMPKNEARAPEAQNTPARTLDSDELALLMKRAQDALQNGDIASARLLLRRAAGAGNGQAALALGATYDPVVLAAQGVLGLAPDLAAARNWYERAAQLGVVEATRRLERITQSAGR